MLAGKLAKMLTQLSSPVDYTLPLGDERLPLNNLLEKKITLRFLNKIQCVQCDRVTNKSFQGGYCFPCFKRLQECGVCTLFPEKCKFPEGHCDPADWVHASCGQPHIVYLSNTTTIKIGITRATQVPTRWIDQGAIAAIPIFSVANRYQSGIIEMAFKAFIADKTDWRALLKNKGEYQDLIPIRNALFKERAREISGAVDLFKPEDVLFLKDTTVTEIEYPVLAYPEKLTTFNFDKTNVVEGALLGIKGQYLILDTGVLNIRKFSGYCVEVSL